MMWANKIPLMNPPGVRVASISIVHFSPQVPIHLLPRLPELSLDSICADTDAQKAGGPLNEQMVM